MVKKLVTALDEITKKVKGTVGTEDGFICEGIAYHVAPLNQRVVLDLTTPPGKASGILLGYFFYLGKRGFAVEKIEDRMEISPVHAQYYELTVRQKQTLERQMKEGLAGISAAVSDFELLWHDQRKYEEFMDVFEKIERAKKEKDEKSLKEGEQTLKSIFIDQVDVHTGEGIALKLIAPRWPTIIADFMRLKDEDVEPKNISKTYKVSEAEGVVLATKNKLYQQWRGMFKSTVMGRFERINGLVKAREKSIEEYRNMMRPYVTRFRSIRELGETPEGRRFLERKSWYRPSAQAISVDITKTWAWKSFIPPELSKASAEATTETYSILKMPFPRQFKALIRRHYKEIKGKDLEKVETSPTGIEPLDKFVLTYIHDIEKHYNITFSISDVIEARNAHIDMCKKMEWTSPYFISMEIGSDRTVMKMPDGSEFEDMWLEPFYSFLDTQNVILLRMLEIKAKEIELENYITEILGETSEGSKIKELVKRKYPSIFGEEIKKEEEKEKTMFESLSKTIGKTMRSLHLIKPGQYETHFEDRITGPYFTEIADSIYMPSISIFKAAVGVPGFRAVT